MLNKKKADPTIQSAPITLQPNDTKIYIACPYERRLLSQLVKGQASRKSLDSIIGTTNTPEYVRRLRERGLGIVTHKAHGLNRDGRRVWWGIYRLDDADKARVLNALGAQYE